MTHREHPDKATVEQIRQRFDNDVERFSSLETGQSTTIDAPLVLELIIEAAVTATPHASRVLDIGCGAGNYTLKLLQRLPHLDVTLIDLSRPMLDRAAERIRAQTSGDTMTLQGDVRELGLGELQYDLIMAGAVLHHLRGDEEWQAVFAKLYSALRPGGSIWISDLIKHSTEPIQTMMWKRYGEYLTQLRDEAYRDFVFDYIAREDSPRPLLFQIDLLREVGFRQVDILHKNGCFATFGAIK
jgi:tRNA (cmo5U34)-methyltransferase